VSRLLLDAGAVSGLAPATEVVRLSDLGGCTDLMAGGRRVWTNPFDWGQARFRRGEVRLTADRKFFLVMRRTYGDFLLEGEARIPPGATAPCSSGAAPDATC
jgi:hypothetical protein